MDRQIVFRIQSGNNQTKWKMNCFPSFLCNVRKKVSQTDKITTKIVLPPEV